MSDFMARDNATDEWKVQVVGKSRELRILTTWAWAMRFWGTEKLTRKQAVSVRMDCHMRKNRLSKLLVRTRGQRTLRFGCKQSQRRLRLKKIPILLTGAFAGAYPFPFSPNCTTGFS